MPEPDRILIEQLEISAKVGVPYEERAASQRLTVSLSIEPQCGFRAAGDAIEATVDYFAVCRLVKELAQRGSWKLIETLAVEIADSVLASFSARAIEVELRKYILPDTAFVAVRTRREKGST